MNIAEEAVDEEAEDDALFADKKKGRRPPSKKGKSQPASSAAREAEAVELTAQWSFQHTWLLKIVNGALKVKHLQLCEWSRGLGQ